MINNFSIITGQEKYPLFDRLTKHTIQPIGTTPVVIPAEIVKFKNDNIKVKINNCVRGSEVFVIQPCYPHLHDRLFEVLILIDALKNASASKVTAILPYFPYVRSDKKEHDRISITAKMIAKLLQSVGTDHVITVCLHSPQTQGFFDIPMDHLLPSKTICEHFITNKVIKENTMIIAPDAGSVKMASHYARKLNLPLSIVDKKRIDDTESAISGSIIGDVSNKSCLIIDDEIATGNSIFKATLNLLKNGAVDVSAFAVHGVLVGDALKMLNESPLKQLYITDTIWRPEVDNNPKITTISISKMIFDAIICINSNLSMANI